MSNIAMRIEDLACYGFGVGETLTSVERSEVVEFTLRFEECSESREALESMTDQDLVNKSYRVMAEYASGQI